MGYYTTKFSTIFKGPVMMALKERRKSRIVIRTLHRLYKQITKILPKEIEVQHRVTHALKDIRIVLKEMEKAEKGEKAIPLDVMMQEDNLMDAVIKYIDTVVITLERLEKEAKRDPNLEKQLREVETFFKWRLSKVLDEGGKLEHELYKEVLNIIGAVEHKDLTFYQKLTKTFKSKEVGQLQLMRLRMDESVLRKDIIFEKKSEKQIIRDLNDLSQDIIGKKKMRGDIEKHIQQLKAHIEQNGKALHDAIMYAFYVLKRDFLLTYLSLWFIFELRTDLVKWARANLIPRAPALEFISKLKFIYKEMAEDLHTIAQGFRITEKEVGTALHHAKAT